MSILPARRPAAKFSTLAPSCRERRPFGVGILEGPGGRSDPWDVEADPADWPADADADRWTITDPPLERRTAAGAGSTRPFVPTREDAAWFLAFNLGRTGVGGRACANWPAAVRTAFDDGIAAGELRRLADHERGMADAADARGMPWDDEDHDLNDYIDARRALPRAVAAD